MAERASRVSPLWAALSDNLGLKLISLALAVVLFSLARGSEAAQRSVFVDVAAIHPSGDSSKVLISELPDKVKVTLRGSRARLNELRGADIPPVEIDLADTERRYVYFEFSEIDLPAGISVIQIAPSTINLTWADAEERRIPVEVSTSGSLPAGLALPRNPEATPAEIAVRGPASVVQSMKTIYTEPIHLGELDVGIHKPRVPLEPPAPHVVYRDDVLIEATLDVSFELKQRKLVKLEIAVVGDRQAALRPSKVDVTMQGPKHLLEAFERERLVPYVELAEADSPSATELRPVKLRGIPEELSVVRIEPTDVLVKIMEAAARPAIKGRVASKPTQGTPP